MKSPFPGMDPYLEPYWGDIHSRLSVYLCDAINEGLPRDLQAHVEQSVMIDSEEQRRTVYPDAMVVETPERLPETEFGGGTAVAVEAASRPCVVAIPDEKPTLRHIEIIQPGSGNRVITAIELLSPANKVGEKSRRAYEHKQRQYMEGGVNLVEIDLIRAGSFILAIPEEHVPTRCRTPYLICVRRANRPYEAELYPIPLQEALPNIPIPLRPTDTDLVVRLQPLLDTCYERGRYGNIDYRCRLDPPLSDDDRKWTEGVLRSVTQNNS